MSKSAATVLGFALIVLFGVIAVPAMIDGTGDNQETINLDVNGSDTANSVLQVTLEDTTTDTATVTVADTETLETQTNTTTVGNTTTYEFEGGNVDVMVNSVSGDSAELFVVYPSTYGWDSGAKTIANNLPLILISLLFVIIMSLGIKSV